MALLFGNTGAYISPDSLRVIRPAESSIQPQLDVAHSSFILHTPIALKHAKMATDTYNPVLYVPMNFKLSAEYSERYRVRIIPLASTFVDGYFVVSQHCPADREIVVCVVASCVSAPLDVAVGTPICRLIFEETGQSSEPYLPPPPIISNTDSTITPAPLREGPFEQNVQLLNLSLNLPLAKRLLYTGYAAPFADNVYGTYERSIQPIATFSALHMLQYPSDRQSDGSVVNFVACVGPQLFDGGQYIGTQVVNLGETKIFSNKLALVHYAKAVAIKPGDFTVTDAAAGEPAISDDSPFRATLRNNKTAVNWPKASRPWGYVESITLKLKRVDTTHLVNFVLHPSLIGSSDSRDDALILLSTVLNTTDIGDIALSFCCLYPSKDSVIGASAPLVHAYLTVAVYMEIEEVFTDIDPNIEIVKKGAGFEASVKSDLVVAHAAPDRFADPIRVANLSPTLNPAIYLKYGMGSPDYFVTTNVMPQPWVYGQLGEPIYISLMFKDPDSAKYPFTIPKGTVLGVYYPQIKY